MKKAISTLLSIFICFNFFPVCSSAGISAKYACVIDADSGNVLFDKNAYSRHSMASTTKIMTAHLALKLSSPDEIVTVSQNASRTEGSSMYLKPGEKIKMSDVLYGLMLASGNDAAVAIAEHIADTTNNFAKLMTEEAQKLGAKNTSFKNPNGLDAEGHFTTAYDLALITKEALKNSDFLKIVSTKTKEIKGTGDEPSRFLSNHNRLLNSYDGCIGVKTGYTKKTGRCLVTAAKRDNLTLICVTLSAPDDWNDHRKLLDDAFSKYEAIPFVKKDMIIKELPVIMGDRELVSICPNDSYYTIAKKGGTAIGITQKIMLPESLRAPITAGNVVGLITVKKGNDTLKQIELIAKENVNYIKPPAPSFLEILKRFLVPFA